MLHGLLALTLWGLLPFYWKAMHGIEARTILAHRTAWAALVAIAVATVAGQWRPLWRGLRRPKALRISVAAGLLLSVNSLTYIWAVNQGAMAQASLGFFINPLCSVALGTLILKESLRPARKVAIGLVAITILGMAWQNGEFPWLALLLATTFALYGLLRKLSPLDAVHGFVLETLMIAPLGIAYLVWLAQQDNAAWRGHSAHDTMLLAGCGVVTAIPLLLYASAARRLHLSTLGFMQYINPMLQLALAVWVYGEVVQPAQRVGFLCIWAALLLYSADVWRELRLPRTRHLDLDTAINKAVVGHR